MTSGIYKLTFPDGATYIGKSVNIEQRMRQHATSFVKGKHSDLMQCAFDKYGVPKAETIFICHPNHLNVLEALFINMYNGPKSLNTVIPDNPFPNGIEMELTSTLDELSKKSLVDICKQYEKLVAEVTELKQDSIELREENNFLAQDRTLEEIKYDIEQKVSTLTAGLISSSESINELTEENEQLSSQVILLLAEINKPWYKRLFNLR
jgi:hypothetical protein